MKHVRHGQTNNHKSGTSRSRVQNAGFQEPRGGGSDTVGLRAESVRESGRISLEIYCQHHVLILSQRLENCSENRF